VVEAAQRVGEAAEAKLQRAQRERVARAGEAERDGGDRAEQSAHERHGDRLG